MKEKVARENSWGYRLNHALYSHIQHCAKIIISIVQWVLCALCIAFTLFSVGLVLYGLIIMWKLVLFIFLIGAMLGLCIICTHYIIFDILD